MVVSVLSGGRVDGADAEHRPSVGAAPLIGRDEELATVVAALAVPPALVVVEGEAGIGKTRLVAEARAHALVDGRRFLTGHCRPVQGPFPLGPVLDAVRVLDGLGDVHAASHLSAVAGVLRPLLPELAPALPPLPEPLSDRDAERHRVCRALVDVLQAACPAVLVLEDLHWADAHTLDFVRYLLMDPPSGLTLVATLRPEETGTRLRAALSRTPATVRRTELRLSPLDTTQTGRLAAAMADHDGLSADFSAALRDRTGGLPFAVEQVVALLCEHATGQGRQPWRRELLDELAVPALVRDHVLARVGRLPASVRTLLEAVSVAGSMVTEARVAQLSGHDGDDVAAGLSDAVGCGLLVEDGCTVGFRHALAARAVYDGIPGPRRRAWHRRAAAVCQQQGARPAERARHLRHAGRTAEWVQAAEEAAAEAVAAGHDDEAAHLLEDVLRHAPLDDEARIRLTVAFGRAVCAMLHPTNATDLLLAALDREPPRAVRAELQMLLGAVLDRSDTIGTRSRALFQQAVANAGDRSDVKAWAMVALEIRNTPEAPYEERRRWLHRVLELLPGIADPHFRVFLLGKVGLVLVALGDPRWRRVADRIEGTDRPVAASAAASASPAAPPHHRRINAYESVGSAACFVGHHEFADRFLGAALAGATAGGWRRMELATRATLALLDYCRGRWDGLAATARQLQDELEDARASHRLDVVVAGLALARGELDRVAAPLDAMMDAYTEGDGSDTFPMAAGTLVRLMMARDDVATAVQFVDAYLEWQRGHESWPAFYRALPWFVQVLTAAGRVAQAQELTTAHEHRLRDRDAPLAPAALRHARGYLAAASGAYPDAAAWLTAAAVRYERLHSVYEAAQAREAAAGMMLAGGDGARAEALLRAALSQFARLGARWDLARAARTARQHGISVPARHRGGHRGYGTALSPREREVAQLAATGRTNKEIAAELYLSAETVKKHLQSAMRKLSVSTRAGLAHRLPTSS